LVEKFGRRLKCEKKSMRNNGCNVHLILWLLLVILQQREITPGHFTTMGNNSRNIK
jgi:hypothetical protein